MQSAFVTECLREYYQKNDVAPPDVGRREFGFGWKDKIDYRHKQFVDAKSLKEFFVKEVPFYASYSLAHYEFPAARPMPKKVFIGADLVFDLDTTYESEKHEHNMLLCHYCLGRVTQDAIRLREEFLLKDFGFSKDEIITNFSGQKGFHLHVRSESVQQVSSNARKELLDYVSGSFETEKLLGISSEETDSSERKKAEQATGPSKQSAGWSKKIYEKTKSLLETGDKKTLTTLGFSNKDIKYVLANKEEAISQLEKGHWSAFCSESAEVFKNIAREIKVSTTVEIDKAVTFDIARLIRLPNSIHGSTGFAARVLTNLENFDPTKQCTITTGTANVKTTEDFKITFAGEEFDFKAGIEREVPKSLALFLACKGKIGEEGTK